MRATRTLLAAALLSGGVFPPAHAVIAVKYPMERMVAEVEFIFEGRVAAVDGEKKRLTVDWVRDLKGKLPFARLHINLAAARKPGDPEKVLERVRDKLPLVFFARQVKQDLVFLGFTEGTWFSLAARSAAPGGRNHDEKPVAKAACAFKDCEIYLRRTYAGKTKELLELLPDVISGKRSAPPYDEKVKPGLGPKLADLAEGGSGEDRGGSGEVKPRAGEGD